MDDGYSNPFDEEGTGDPFQQSGAAAGMTTAPPRPTMRPVSRLDNLPTTANSAYGRPTMNEEQLRQKELELARREQMLEYKERKVEEIKTTLTKGKPKPNFPRCWPLWYHNINEEIPEKGRNLVKRMFAAWIFSMVCYPFNAVATLARLIGTQSAGSSGTDFGISLLYLFVGPLVSFTFWYRPFYYAVRKSRSMSYFIFFFNFGFHIGYCVVMAIGIPSTGGGGFIMAFETIGTNAGAGVILIISGALWALLTTYCCFQIITAFRYYRSAPPVPEGPHAAEIGASGVTVDAGGSVIGGVTVPAGTKITVGV